MNRPSRGAFDTRATEPAATDSTALRPLRAIAGLELLKGLLALAAGLGLLGLVHHDLHRLAAAFIGHVGLNPGGHYPQAMLASLDTLLAADRRTLLLAVAGYSALRCTEAWGLWHARRWGEWLGALSGALYLPFELQHLLHQPHAATALVMLLNLALVLWLARRLWLRGAAAA